MVLKTWTLPNPSACGRKLARSNRRLCEKMKNELENLRKAKLLKKGDGEISSAVEAGEPLGEGDKEAREGTCGGRGAELKC